MSGSPRQPASTSGRPLAVALLVALCAPDLGCRDERGELKELRERVARLEQEKQQLEERMAAFERNLAAHERLILNGRDDPAGDPRPSPAPSEPAEPPGPVEYRPEPSASTECPDEEACLLMGRRPACCDRYESVRRGGPPAAALPRRPSREEIATIMRRAGLQVRACAAKVGLSGKITVKVVVAPDGSVSSARVRVADDRAADGCIERSISRLDFPRTRKGARFTYPFQVEGRPPLGL